MHSDNRGCSKIDFPFAAPNYTTLAIDSRGYMTWDTSPKVELDMNMKQPWSKAQILWLPLVEAIKHKQRLSRVSFWSHGSRGM